MVQLVAAGGVEDAPAVELERSLVRLDADADGLQSKEQQRLKVVNPPVARPGEGQRCATQATRASQA